MADFDPNSPGFLADPYPTYHRLRERSPVLGLRQGGRSLYYLTRHADVLHALKDDRFSVELARAGGPSANSGGSSMRTMLGMDPPDHTRLRGLVSQAFTPRVVERLRTRLEELVAGLLAPLAERPTFDWIADLAGPLPVVVISELLGLPREDERRIKDWSNDLTLLLDAMTPAPERRRAQASAVRLKEYLQAIVHERRREPRDDLISRLVAVQEAGDELSDEEILSTSFLLVLAGHETTSNLLGNGLLALFEHPAEFERLREDPDLVVPAIEELLRYDSPIQVQVRIALEGAELAGVPVEPGSIVFAILGAANRDPERFPDPDRLDLTRKPNPHVAFGHGRHFCLGAPLARLEARVVFETLLAKGERLALEPGGIGRRMRFAFRGLESLVVRRRG